MPRPEGTEALESLGGLPAAGLKNHRVFFREKLVDVLRLHCIATL